MYRIRFLNRRVQVDVLEEIIQTPVHILNILLNRSGIRFFEINSLTLIDQKLGGRLNRAQRALKRINKLGQKGRWKRKGFLSWEPLLFEFR